MSERGEDSESLIMPLKPLVKDTDGKYLRQWHIKAEKDDKQSIGFGWTIFDIPSTPEEVEQLHRIYLNEKYQSVFWSPPARHVIGELEARLMDKDINAIDDYLQQVRKASNLIVNFYKKNNDIRFKESFFGECIWQSALYIARKYDEENMIFSTDGFKEEGLLLNKVVLELSDILDQGDTGFPPHSLYDFYKETILNKKEFQKSEGFQSLVRGLLSALDEGIPLTGK